MNVKHAYDPFENNMLDLVIPFFYVYQISEVIRMKQLLQIQLSFSLQTKQSGHEIHLFPLVWLLKPGVEQALPVRRELTQKPLCFAGSSLLYERGLVHEACSVW